MKRFIKRVAGKATAVVYSKRPLESWPAVVGRLQDVATPRNVVPHPTPQPVGSANINILLQMIRQTARVEGDVTECGVFRGQTIVPMAIFLRQEKIPKRVFGFDSFEGFPDTIKDDIAKGGAQLYDKRVGGMNETSRDLVQRKLDRFDLTNVDLIKGFFENTLPQVSNRRFSLVHLDCDIYSSYKETLEFFYPRLNRGAIVLLDEYNDPPWPGCNKAVDEFLAGKPEKLQVINRDNYLKYYFERT